MSLRRNILTNIIGSALPIAVTIFTVPLYLKLLGETRYGILAIIWIFVGYFSLFDIGLGRATNNQISKLKNAASVEREKIFWTALLLNGASGILGGAIFLILGKSIMKLIFSSVNDQSILYELLSVLPWLAVAIPIVTMASVLTGSLEGRERFFLTNVIQVFGFLIFQLLPLLMAYLHGPELDKIIPAAICSRIVTFLVLFAACKIYLPLVQFCRIEITKVKILFCYGGWVTLSGIISPILTSLDRILIGSSLGAQAVTHYTVPFNLSLKLLIFPGALTRSLFPRFSIAVANEANDLMKKGILLVSAVLTPIVILMILFLKDFLSFWISPELATISAPVGKILLFGIWINSLAFIPYSYLQGQGKPNVVAIIHLIELLPFLFFLWLSMTYLGLVGAAIAWSLRVFVDAVLLYNATRLSWRNLLILIIYIFLIFVAYFTDHIAINFIIRSMCAIGLILISFCVGFRWSFSEIPYKMTISIFGNKKI